jgi:nucleotide-binding universal stress UspA family protein
MPIAFNTILIPVDFSLNTEIAVKKAAGLVGSDKTILHLLHVMKSGKRRTRQFRLWAVEKELNELSETIRADYPGLRIKTHILRGHSVQRLIIDCAAMVKPDLIIIGKQNNRRRWSVLPHITPDAIAKKSNCPVLTVKPGSFGLKTRVIVIPIRDFLPERKLELAVLLAKRYKAQVHLLAIQDHPEPKEWALPQVFLKAYHHLREHLHHPIEYSSTGRHSPARAVLNYAELIMADMILVNPETESGVAGVTGWRHMSDLVDKDSRLQILDVEPYK